MIKIYFPDGTHKYFYKGITPIEISKELGGQIYKKTLSVLLNGEQCEMNKKIYNDSNLFFLTWEDDAAKRVFWHSSAHLLAQAVKELYPFALLTIGPPIENGFYYDIDFLDYKFTDKDFSNIEKVVAKNISIESEYVMSYITKQEALKIFKDNPYKIEIISNLRENISICTHGNFVDLCKGGHILNTNKIKAFKLLSTSGAYWKGDSNNKMLTRIYGISFPKKSYLNNYINFLTEAKKRDHRKIGKDLKLFIFSERVGQGLPLWLPKGTNLRNKLQEFLISAQRDRGYEMVYTPHIGNKKLYVISGHYDKYGEDSFKPIYTPSIGEEFLLKPMNCPHHCEIYKHGNYSYRDLPKRYAEFGNVYRYEKSGELHGLTRVRGFTQDDAHIFCTEDQILDEFKNVIDLVMFVFKKLGFHKYYAQVSLRDKLDHSKYIGSEENWNKAEQYILLAAKDKGLDINIEYGEAAFYGPKLDFMVTDSLNRKWQLGTIQVDYNLPERFNLLYRGKDNNFYRPVMIHRAPFGSLERFIAILLENTGGNLPLWLIDDLFVILNVSEKNIDYCKNIFNSLIDNDIKGKLDCSMENMNKKIKDAKLQKIPFIIVLGDYEENNNLLSVKVINDNHLKKISLNDFILMVKKELNV